MVQPDGPFRTGNFIPQVHTTPESPVNFELAEGTIGKAYESYPVVFCLNGMYHGIGSTDYFDR